jgi:octaprenyl-diphosphate synthase
MMGPLNQIYRPIQSPLTAAERLFVKELAGGMDLRSSLLRELTHHVARMPGKRIRPALAIFGAYLGHGIAERRFRPNGSSSWMDQTLLLAVAVEMIHTATLLHDDVIDGATLRRGLSTLNAKWGDTLSILSGDYLYAKAFCLLSDLRSPAVSKLMSETARSVCEGEVAQIQHQYDLSLSRKRYLKIIQKKTASLMGASIQAGALIGGASEDAAHRLGVFGRSFGLAFQILDDLEDLMGKEEQAGKSLGTDLALGQMTLPLLFLRDATGSDGQKQLAQWFRDIPNWSFGNGLGVNDELRHRLDRIRKEALKRRVPERCKEVASRYLAKARKALDGFPNSPYRSSLLALTGYLLRF